MLELSDGSRQVLAFTGSTSPLMLTTERWRADCNSDGTGLVVYAPDGTRYDMSQQVIEMGEYSWYVKSITDRNNNFITVNYVNSYSAEITSVTTSDGRSLNFTYDGQGTTSHRVRSISSGSNQTYYYDYSPIPGVLGGYYLTAVRRPDGTQWQYAYNNLLPDYQAGSYHLKQMTYPEGGAINYGYDYVYFDRQNTNPPGRSVVVAQKSDSLGGSWNFTYTPGASGQYDETRVDGPSGRVTYQHVGPNYSSSGTVWMVGLLVSKQVGSAQTETYTWDKQKVSDENNFRSGLFVTKIDGEVYSPTMTGKRVVRDGATYNTTYGQLDAYGNPRTVSASGPNGGNRTSTFTYFTDASKWIINQVKDESFAGSSVSRSFDSRGNLTVLTQNGVTTRYSYDGDGNISSITFPRGLTHSYGSYRRGIAQSESQPEGIAISRTVTDAGNVGSERNGEGYTTRFDYDGLNRLTRIDPPLGNSTTISYSFSSGGYTKTAQRGSLSEVTRYDALGRPTSITLGGITHTYRYDTLGRRTFASNPSSSAGTSYEYDILDRIVKITNADGSSQAIAYGAGYKAVTDERGHTTTYTYRSYGEPTQQFLMAVSAPVASASLSLGRNSVDLVTAVSQDGSTRQYGYNGSYYLTSVTEPETGTTVYGRDEAGNMTSRRVGASGTTAYTYDNQNRLYSVDYPGSGEFVTHTYTKTHKLKAVASSGATRSFDYDANDNLTSDALTVDGYVFRGQYAYNANDQLSSQAYPYSNQAVAYSPDLLGRPTQVASYVAGVEYWPSGQVQKIAYGNGTMTNYGQNSRLWPSYFQASKPGSPLYINSQYAYDGAGNLTQITDSSDANYRRTLGYDALNRLTSVGGPWGSGSITYNGSGDITRQSFGSSQWDYSYDGQNRLSRVSGARVFAFDYDAYGNAKSDGYDYYIHDDVPNLRCVSPSGLCDATSKVSYAYDGLNRRVQVNRSGVKTYEFHDSKGLLLVELTPDQGNRLVEYFYLGNQRVAQRVSGRPALTVTKAGSGSGTVTSAPAGINCGTTCSASFTSGTVVTLTATPASGSVFAGWGGACAGSAVCQVTLNASQNVTVAFNPANLAAIQSIITHYYQSILGRAPDLGGFSYWQNEAVRLQESGVDVREVFRVMANQFFGSQEYLAKNTNDTQYVTDLYRTFFNRAPDAGGLSGWLSQLAAGMPRSNVLYGFLTSAEFNSYLQGQLGNTNSRQEVYMVVGFYGGALNRLPDSGGFSYWLSRVRAAQCQNAATVIAEADTISRTFLTSAEYVNRRRSNRDYVADLYYIFLRRSGDLGGLNYWAGQLDNGAFSREQERVSFLQSAEFQGWVQQVIAQGCLR